MRFLWAMIVSCAAWAAPGWAEPALRVEVVEVAPKADQFDYRLAGTIEAPDSVGLSFRDGGRVTAVAVEPGDRLAPGEEVARIDPTQAEAALAAATAGVAGAEAAQVEAESAATRIEAQLAKGVATRAEADAAAQRRVAALAALDQAKAQVAKAQRAVEDTVLRAPAAALVIERSAEPGQIVGAGQAIVTLAPGKDRLAVFHAPDSIDLSAYLGTEITLEEIDGPLRLAARLSEISPLVEQGTVRVRAEILAPPADLPLLGVPVVGHLHLEGPPVISLPWEALNDTAEGPAVWRVDAAGKVALVPVRVERYDDGAVLIAEGLAAGDRIVTKGSQRLYPGRSVEAQP